MRIRLRHLLMCQFTQLPVEVGHDDGDGEGDAEHAADGAQRPNKLAGSGQGSNVSIAWCLVSESLWLPDGVTCAGHGDDGPVQGLGQGVEHCARLILLQGVGQAREDQHAHADRHAQQQ